MFSNLTKFTAEIAQNYGIDTNLINGYINKYSSKLLEYLEIALGNGTIINLLNTSVSYITNTIIIAIVSVYFLNDMDFIRKRIKTYLLKLNQKKYRDQTGLFLIEEYTILFLLIGHPNFLLIGVLACITTIIPYFGGIFTNILALLIASVISKRLFILTLIITLVFPNIDGYVISPKIYGKTNELPAVLTVFVVFAGGALFGFTGIVIAVPLTIILMAIIKAYKPELQKNFKKIKNKNKI